MDRQWVLVVLVMVGMGVDLVGQQAPSAPRNVHIVVDPDPPSPPPTPGTIWGVAAADILGTCSQATHDRYTLDGGDGFRYRTLHPQVDPSGCVFSHEHGDDPRSSRHPEISALPVLFGYIGRRMPMPHEPNGHEEPHEGFKIFVVNPGDVNDEDRVNRVYSLSAFHMGTGGPRRFSTQHHSADIRVIHPEFGLEAFTRLMMDTGGTEKICDQRANTIKTVVTLDPSCQLGSLYEIWSTTAVVRYQGREVYRAFATPAVFDPITVFDPNNPTRLLYTFDPAVNVILRFPNQDRSYVRGCDRESYAQPGYWYNANSGRTVFYTDSMGNEVGSTDPRAIAQTISQSNSIGAPATSDGLGAFKQRRSWCQNDTQLGLKN